MSDGLLHPDWIRWLNLLKDRAETIVAISPEQIVPGGTFDPALLPPIPWDLVLKAGSSLGDLETRNAADLSSGTLPNARLADVNGDVGTFGSASLIPVVTVTAKGLVTAVTEVEALPLHYYEPLTNGDPVTPEIVFDSEGDVVMVLV